MKLSETEGGAPATEGQRTKLSAVGQEPEAEQPGQPEQPSQTTSLWQGLLHGLGNPAMGIRQLAARIPGNERVARMVGEEPETPQAADRAAMQRQQEYRGPFAPGPGQPLSPARANPVSAGVGELVGEGVATAPLAAVGGGTGIGARAALGALGGGLAGATNPVVSGRDFWTEKATQTGLGAATGGAMSAGGALLNPRLGADAAEMARRGVDLTPGQRLGVQGAERKLQAFPILRGFVESNIDRSVEGFNRAAVRQALEPIGAVMPRAVRAGHDMMQFMDNALETAYNTVLPQVAPLNRQTVESAILNNPALAQFRGELSTDAAARLDRMIQNRVLGRFDAQTGMMDGPVFKRVESDLGSRARSLNRTNDSEIGEALTMVNAILRDELVNANAGNQMGQYLRNINHAWAMSVRLRQAGARRADSESVFTPSDLLTAVRDSDPSTNHSIFNHGDALMQPFAEQANRVLGRSVRRYEDPSAGSQIAGFASGVGPIGGPIYAGISGAQRHPWIGGTVTTGAPAAGVGAGSVVSRAPEDKKKPRTPSAGP